MDSLVPRSMFFGMADEENDDLTVESGFPIANHDDSLLIDHSGVQIAFHSSLYPDSLKISSGVPRTVYSGVVE